jgi:hypothetical protein
MTRFAAAAQWKFAAAALCDTTPRPPAKILAGLERIALSNPFPLVGA